MSSGSAPDRRPRFPRDIVELKGDGRPIVAVTAYDYTMARLVQEAGVDLVLVGDSLGQVVLGYESTLPVTLDEMLHHAKAVTRGVGRVPTVLDMPFLSYQVSIEETLRNAGRALKETGVEAVKLEGGDERVCEAVAALVAVGIPVMGHVGLTPQSVNQLGGYRVQGRDPGGAERLQSQALALEEAGCFAVVLELVPGELATRISESLAVPTIGIGAGAGCDGQVLVLYDLLGMNRGFRPRFLKRYADLDDVIVEAVRRYADDVRGGRFPGEEHTFSAGS